MRSSKIFLTFLIVFAVAQFCAGQEVSKATIIGSYQTDNCDYSLASADNLFEAAFNSAGAKALVVIYSDANSTGIAVRQEIWLNTYVKFRKFPAGRFEVIQVRRDGLFKVELWMVPNGAAKPAPDGEVWTNKLPAHFNPINLGGGETEACPYFSFTRYTELLRENPAIIARLTIYAASARAARKEQRETLAAFSKNFQIPAGRFKIGYKIRKPDYPGEPAMVNYELISGK